MPLLANDDFPNRDLSIDELEAIAAGVGLRGPGPIISPLPPHLPHWPPAPSQIWARGSVGLVTSFKLF
jgi:hypothetical protein